ncbi:MAG: DUF4118 domain-containing protein, partial [Caulobacter sp.]|nr:DUF4118 domain-containing protein [Vitreoscilla sp.]
MPPSSPSDLSATRPQAPRRWILTLLTAVVAIALRAALQPMLGDSMPFLVAYPAVAFAASLWGIGPGFSVALACALVVCAPWVAPSIPPADQPVHIGAFLLAAIFIALVTNLRVLRTARAATPDDATAFDSPLATWLRAVLWGSMLVPLTAFVAASWWGYERAVAEAEAAAERTAVLVRGQA